MLFMMIRVQFRVFAMVVMAWFLTMGVAHAQTVQRSITPILKLLLEDECSQTETKIVTPTAGSNGSISPSTPQTVYTGCTTTFTVTPDANYGIDTVSGCSGYLNGSTYATGRISENCTVTAAFLPAYSVTASAGTGGTINPTSASVTQGKTTSFTVTPNTGYAIDSVGGTCGGSLTGATYTTLPITMACTVTASFTPTYTVTATAGTGGTITPGSAVVVQNQTQVFTVTANSGYIIGTVTGCGGSLVGNTYTTGPVTVACTVTASFTPTFTVTATAGTGGTITPGSAVVVQNQTQAFSVTANSGYVIGSVTGCGGSLVGNTYTTGPVTAACTVTASFTPTFAVTATAGAGGAITPGSAVVIQNQTQAFTVTPDSGYAIKSVTGCSGSLSGNTYTTGPITAACTVSATFQAVLTVTASVTGGVGGLVTPTSQVVASGTTARVTLQPYSGYVIDSVGGTCGGTMSDNTYTTNAVTANCTVTATFILASSAPTYEITTNAGTNGSITPLGMTVSKYSTWSFTLTPDIGYMVDTATGCGGSLDTLTSEYTTGPITANCTVSATFRTATPSYTVTATAGSNGTISPSSRSVPQGQTTTFDVTPVTGYTASMGGTCGGSLTGSGTTKTYTTNAINANCTVTASFSINSSPSTDPGYKSNVLWIPPGFVAPNLGDSTLVVADTSGSSTWPPVTYIPGCINGGNATNYNNGCAAGYDYTGVPAGLTGDYTVTMGPTKTLSIRLKANSTLSTAIKSIKISTADGGSNLPGSVSLWLTTDPTVSYDSADSRCKDTKSSNLYIYTHATNPSYCPLTPNGFYYLNVRANFTCTTQCRFKIDGAQDDFQ